MILVTHEMRFARDVADRSSSCTWAGSTRTARRPRCSPTRGRRNSKQFLEAVL